MLKAGIDEAGRGPVIGPIVIAGVVIDDSDEVRLKKMGVKDSKLLTKEKREFLYNEILKIIKDKKIIKVFPEEIDARASVNLNLNELEAVKSAEIVNGLNGEFNPDSVIVDCPSPNIAAYRDFISRYVNDEKIKIIPEHKADYNHVVVAAASILAKVERDRDIENLKEQIGVDFGSGYPSDPKTQKFLEENWEKYPGLFRKTWDSWKVLNEKKCQKGLFDF
ncbi:ribonuclease HII [Candidatus Woesearchaeota archaeon]|nr:ribonuclease HII [Candidatus Woesearchaeota archaeon]